MNDPLSDMQRHVQFQLSLLRLVDSQNGSESPLGQTVAKATEQEHLKDAFAKIVSAIH
ncbi:MAG: hypothetical protein ABI822_01240 [Bryobacteraceae bacterium]